MVHFAEHLPRLAVKHSDAVHLLEVGFDQPVPARDFDDLLSEESGWADQDGHRQGRAERGEPAGVHR